jgi:hypothetical protein
VKLNTNSNEYKGAQPHSAPFTVSVIIPTLNEVANLPLVLPYLPLDLLHEVILVDGRSTDGTVEAARRLLPSIKVLLEPARGKGVALRRGYAAARGDIILVLDADGSNDPREIPRFLRALLEGADFVKGSRFAPLGGTSDMPLIRKLGNSGFVRMANLLFGSEFSDLCYGYHAFWRYCLDVVSLDDIDGFEIDTAIYLRAQQARLRIVDVPSFEGYRFYGVGKLKMIPDGWRVLRTILREWGKSLTAPALPPFMGFRRPPAELAPGDPAFALQPMPGAAFAAGSGHSHLPIYLDLLIEVLSGLNGQANRQRLMRYVLERALQHLGAASGSLLVLDEAGEVVEGCLTFDRETLAFSPPDCLDVIESGFAGWVAANRLPAIINDTQSDPRWLVRPWEAHSNVSRSALGMPIVVGSRVVGVLIAVGARDQKPFTEEHLLRLAGMPGY